jgi:hypothetical protein
MDHREPVKIHFVSGREDYVIGPDSLAWGRQWRPVDRCPRIDLYYRDSNPFYETKAAGERVAERWMGCDSECDGRVEGVMRMAYLLRWKLILLYIVVAAIVYVAVYYLFLAPPATGVPAAGGGYPYP